MLISELATPALVVDSAALDRNLATMAAARPGAALRPHVKAHKCTALACAQAEVGHTTFTCATPREVVGMAAAGLGDDLLLANETLDPRAARGDGRRSDARDHGRGRLRRDDRRGRAGRRSRDVLDRRQRRPAALRLRTRTTPGALADVARAAGLEVRGVMGYEGHLMMVADRAEQRRARSPRRWTLLLAAHADVGGDVVSRRRHRHLRPPRPWVTEIQAGSYALMDTAYDQLGLPFEQALLWSSARSSRSSAGYAVADVGLKALGMDHGNPSIDGAAVWFCSDEHITFAPATSRRRSATGCASSPRTSTRRWRCTSARGSSRGDEVVDRWPIDLRGW